MTKRSSANLVYACVKDHFASPSDIFLRQPPHVCALPGFFSIIIINMSGFIAFVSAVWWFVSWPFVELFKERDWIDVREFHPDESWLSILLIFNSVLLGRDRRILA